MKITCTNDQGELLGEFLLPSDRDELMWKRVHSYLKKHATLLLKVQRQALGQFIIEHYCEWMEKNHAPAMINGAEGKASQDISKYLMKICEGDQDRAEKSWMIILERHSEWEQFHRKQLKLAQISSNLPNIIAHVKQKHNSARADGASFAQEYIKNRQP